MVVFIAHIVLSFICGGILCFVIGASLCFTMGLMWVSGVGANNNSKNDLKNSHRCTFNTPAPSSVKFVGGV